MLDRCPAVSALGLQCLVSLCRADVLDAYLALRVVLPHLPSAPAHPLPAAAWAALLGCGGMDAAAYPEEATVLLRLLWACTEHGEARVRAAAWAGIGCYPHDAVDAVLEGAHEEEPNVSTTPASAALVQRAVAEVDVGARDAAAATVGARVGHEIATASGRRAVAAHTRAVGAPESTSVRHALLHRVPAALSKAHALAALVLARDVPLEEIGTLLDGGLRGGEGDVAVWGVVVAAWGAAMAR